MRETRSWCQGKARQSKFEHLLDLTLVLSGYSQIKESLGTYSTFYRQQLCLSHNPLEPISRFKTNISDSKISVEAHASVPVN